MHLKSNLSNYKNMKTLLFTSILFIVVSSKQIKNDIAIYRGNDINGNEYTVMSTNISYIKGDTIIFNNNLTNK